MTTVQIVGIAVAAVVVLILVVALVLTRSRGEKGEAPQPASDQRRGSFLDEAPQDTFAGLGKAEQAVEDVTIDPAVEREARRTADAERAAAGQTPPAPAGTPPRRAEGGLGLDWGPSGGDVGDFMPAGTAAAATTAGTAVAGAAAPPDEAEATGELPAVALPPEPPSQAQSPAPTPTEPFSESGGHASPESARPAEGGSVAPEAAPESDAGGRMVPLSSIIVTTSRKMVDVEDPEVRRMLTDLVKFEIDQATMFRRDGQTIDAVLQLTEAEKISRALGVDEAARQIHEMLQEIQAG
jgi:cell division protein FtsN